MKAMGDSVGVPIEPSEQTRLLDACMAQPGVIGCGVPGGSCSYDTPFESTNTRPVAGGYDAIWLLIFNPPEGESKVIEEIENIWKEWKELNVSPLIAQESPAKGVRLENPSQIPGLAQFLV